jgi:hypothetical protein
MHIRYVINRLDWKRDDRTIWVQELCGDHSADQGYLESSIAVKLFKLKLIPPGAKFQIDSSNGYFDVCISVNGEPFLNLVGTESQLCDAYGRII